MSIERMRERLAADRESFIEPCLPSPADKPPSGSNWIHEIKHDGYRLMARRDPVGIRLITRNGHDWAARYPLVVEAVNHLKVASCRLREPLWGRSRHDDVQAAWRADHANRRGVYSGAS